MLVRNVSRCIPYNMIVVQALPMTCHLRVSISHHSYDNIHQDKQVDNYEQENEYVADSLHPKPLRFKFQVYVKHTEVDITKRRLDKVEVRFNKLH